MSTANRPRTRSIRAIHPIHAIHHVLCLAAVIATIATGGAVKAEVYIIEAPAHHLGDDAGNEGTVFQKTFTLPKVLSNARLDFDFIPPFGPNFESPPQVYINGTNVGSIQSFFPPLNPSDPLWQTNPDGSHDYNGAIHVSLPVSSFLTAGANTFQIVNGRPADDYQFDNVQVSEPIGITGLSTHSFVTSDTITLRAQIGSLTANVPVRWTVQGRNAADGISGFPEGEIHLTDGSGTSTFTFTPSANQSLVDDRRTRWTAGSLTFNPPISFEVTASVSSGGQEFQSDLSAAGLGPLSQDETDTLRQEYADYDSAFPGLYPDPGRDHIAPLAAPLNQGNYTVAVSLDLPSKLSQISSAFRRMMVMYNGQKIPLTNALVNPNSGFRSPQRNRAKGGSVAPGIPTSHSTGPSRHVFGRAFDLSPFLQIGRSQMVPPTILYPALLVAAKTVGQAWVEFGDQPGVPQPDQFASDPRVNHVHVQW